ncbi:substrate-binding domain-containing protein [Cereibacter sphaeroides]|uniref:substrate-binding domain-containing protein n=1 Tax=Rhodobacterales TaxID=204455 RepID=UPI0018E09EF6|nr:MULTISPECIES: substrate-binding domain-containing protein [Paracoccaceae]MCE6961574.1 substrate-binding domain-containing protein [Cereibacter sphaeroides]MCE6974924.1 substrate-binding domain-containing protein [Cereibacter sphaeroides]
MMRGVLLAAALAAQPAAAQVADLVSDAAFRVCADPALVPMSSRDGSGFENRIAEHLASALGKPLEYTWFPMATGFVRNTLFAGKCDVVIGYAQGDELVLNTNHYYTSTHVLVVRADGPLAGIERLADPALKGHRIGVVAGSPPASHLARNGLMAKARPYSLMVDRRVEDPAGDMLAAVESGEIDAAVLWGPVGGPLVKAHPALKAIPLVKEEGAPKLFYRITMGVRQGEDVWKRELNSLIRREQGALDAILRDAGVPLLDDYGRGLKEAG